jgi:hypothetical protein
MGSTALWYLAAKLGRLVEWFEEKFRRKNPSSRALPGHTLYHIRVTPAMPFMTSDLMFRSKTFSTTKRHTET